jgi:hypothetical protein
MGQEYNPQPTAPFYQASNEAAPLDLATDKQVADLKKWIMISILCNIGTSLGIIAFLIFIYYTFLIETTDGE